MDNKSITRQALPESDYLELLGIALCVFNSNNSFMIENILRLDEKHTTDWYELLNKTSRKLKPYIYKTVGKHELGQKAAELFIEKTDMRDRIVHSFQITYDGEQILATKDWSNNQFHITREYLKNCILRMKN